MSYLIPTELAALIEDARNRITRDPAGADEILARMLTDHQQFVLERAGYTSLLAARARLRNARRALVADGYFAEEEVGDDIAPRIIELAAHLRGLLDTKVPGLLVESLEQIRRQVKTMLAAPGEADAVALTVWDGKLGAGEHWIGPFPTSQHLERWMAGNWDPGWTKAQICLLQHPALVERDLDSCEHRRGRRHSWLSILSTALPCSQCEQTEHDTWVADVQERLTSALYATQAGMLWKWDIPYAYAPQWPDIAFPVNVTTVRVDTWPEL